MIRSSDHRDLAVFTIVQDEPEFIHAWINHYKKHVVQPADIHVLIHAPTYPAGAEPPPSPAWDKAQELMREHHGVVMVPVHHASSHDHRWLVRTVERFQAFLLQSYEWVLFAEVDEFVAPTPQPARRSRSLLQFVRDIGSGPPPAVRAEGYEIVQQDGEPPIVPSLYADGTNAGLSARDLLAGRGWWYPCKKYCKTLLANQPMQWDIGFHVAEGPMRKLSLAPPSPTLALLHLHRADYDLALGRVRRARMRRWSQLDVEQRLGWQNRIDESQFRDFWNMDSDTEKPLAPGRLTAIPPGFHEAIG